MPTSQVQPPQINQLPIIQVVIDAMNAIGDNLPFGHGMPSYSNAKVKTGIGGLESVSPRAWLHPVGLGFRIKGIQLSTTFMCEIDFLKQAPMKSTTLEQSVILNQMYNLMYSFIGQLIHHINVKNNTLAGLDAIARYHHLDQNTFGWTLFFECELEDC